MTVNVCVGSSCHLKGSYKIISLLTEAVKAHGLGDKVELGAAFCLGKCLRDTGTHCTCSNNTYLHVSSSFTFQPYCSMALTVSVICFYTTLSDGAAVKLPLYRSVMYLFLFI